MHQDDIVKTAITSAFELYEYSYMLFGFKNAATTFQRHMKKIFRNIVFFDIDDILIFRDKISHKKTLTLLSKSCMIMILKNSVSKSLFNETSLNFLGFHISSESVIRLRK